MRFSAASHRRRDVGQDARPILTAPCPARPPTLVPLKRARPPRSRPITDHLLDRFYFLTVRELRARCQSQTNSIVTPMGDEMFYRYQQSLIDEATTTAATLLQPSLSPATDPSRSTFTTQQRANAAGETVEEHLVRQMRNPAGSTR
jgi:hypothetical protein